jgi:hypothetical protein
MILVEQNVAPLPSKELAFRFIHGTFIITTCSLALLTIGLQLDVFQPKMQFINLQIFLGIFV